MITGILPYLNFAGNAQQAMAFYEQALGAQVLSKMLFDEMPGGAQGMSGVMHATLQLGQATIMLSDVPPQMGGVTPGTNQHLMVNLAEPGQVDALFEKLADGGRVLMPVDNTFWGARFGQVVDRFGVSWMLHAELPQD
ncbi:MAG: VOC family protein [Myxococcota bacterium]|nr:VOC family protein [Myxococcota bacterium]